MSHKYFFHYTLSTINIQRRISGPKSSELTQVWKYMLIYFTSPRSNLGVCHNGSVTIHLSHGTISLNRVGEPFFKCLSRNYSQNLQAHYCVHKNLACLCPMPDSVHVLPAYFLRSIVILSANLYLGLPSGLFPADFETKPCMHFPSTPVCTEQENGCNPPASLDTLVKRYNYCPCQESNHKSLVNQYVA